MGQFKPISRGLSWAVPRPAPSLSTGEQESLLADTDEEEEEQQHADADGLYPPHSCWTSDHPHPPQPHAHLPVYRTIHQYATMLIFIFVVVSLGLMSVEAV